MPDRVFVVPSEVPAEWVACRGSRVHWMEWLAVPAGERHQGVVDAWWRCVRCGAERYDQLDPVSLEVLHRKYKHPDGYLMTADDDGGVPAPAAWKATYLNLLGAISDRQASKARRYHKELWEQEND